MSEQDEAFKQAVGRGMAHRRAAHRKLQRAEARIKELEAKISTCPDCNMEYIDHDGAGFCGCVEAAKAIEQNAIKLSKWMESVAILEYQGRVAGLEATIANLREELSNMATQYGCDCGHPACNRCRDTRRAEEASKQ